MKIFLSAVAVAFCLQLSTSSRSAPFRVAVFEVDASPPVGSQLAYDPVKEVQAPLSCRGLVLLGADQPIVLCAIDWIGIGNDGQTVFKRRLAKAAQTSPECVAVHALHQHDAPRCDFSAEVLLNEQGLFNVGFDAVFARSVIEDAANAIAKALPQAKRITQVGLGTAKVEKVASNRRILGPDGRIQHMRFTATRDPKIRALPVGTIDPLIRMIVFYSQDEAVAALSYYATHPQSYYRTGKANPDFPGMARNARQAKTGVPHIHFNGAGGNIGAGKWNDGSHENRQVLADRVEQGMQCAWEKIERFDVTANDVAWQTEAIVLPVAEHLDEETLTETLSDSAASQQDRYTAAKHLAWLRRCRAQSPVHLGCLAIKHARVLHMPGELFVEYQLAAQDMRPDLFVCMAAYGDYAPGYIGTKVAYEQGGYETSKRASHVDPEVEGVLLDAMRKLLSAMQ